MSKYKVNDRVKSGKFRGRVAEVSPTSSGHFYSVSDGKESKPFWEIELEEDKKYYEERDKELKELLDKDRY